MRLTVIQNKKHNLIKIPKVATHTLGKVLQEQHRWNDLNDREIDMSWDFISLIRHPVDRWISGMGTYLCGAPVDDFEDLDALVNSPVHDMHTEPQAAHFKGLKVKLFRLEEIQKFWSFLGIVTDVHRHKRKGPTLPITRQHKEFLASYYKDDLKLWSNANGC